MSALLNCYFLSGVRQEAKCNYNSVCVCRYGPELEDNNGTTATEEDKRGLRVVWARFYGEDYHPLYEEAVRRARVKENRRYLPLTSQTIFDVENYMKRVLLSVEIILLEANTRAEKQNTTAFLHIVGFGLGIDPAYLPKPIPNIS